MRASRPKDSRNELFAFSTTRSQLTMAIPALMEFTMVSLYSLRSSVSRIESCMAAMFCSRLARHLVEPVEKPADLVTAAGWARGRPRPTCRDPLHPAQEVGDRVRDVAGEEKADEDRREGHHYGHGEKGPAHEEDPLVVGVAGEERGEETDSSPCSLWPSLPILWTATLKRPRPTRWP